MGDENRRESESAFRWAMERAGAVKLNSSEFLSVLLSWFSQGAAAEISMYFKVSHITCPRPESCFNVHMWMTDASNGTHVLLHDRCLAHILLHRMLITNLRPGLLPLAHAPSWDVNDPQLFRPICARNCWSLFKHALSSSRVLPCHI